MANVDDLNDISKDLRSAQKRSSIATSARGLRTLKTPLTAQPKKVQEVVKTIKMTPLSARPHQTPGMKRPRTSLRTPLRIYEQRIDLSSEEKAIQEDIANDISSVKKRLSKTSNNTQSYMTPKNTNSELYKQQLKDISSTETNTPLNKIDKSAEKIPASSVQKMKTFSSLSDEFQQEISEASLLIKTLTRTTEKQKSNRNNEETQLSRNKRMIQNQNYEYENENENENEPETKKLRQEKLSLDIKDELNRLLEENQVLHELVKQLEPFEENFTRLRHEFDVYQTETDQRLTNSTIEIGKFILEQKELQTKIKALEKLSKDQKEEIEQTRKAHEILYLQSQAYEEVKKEIEEERDQLNAKLTESEKENKKLKADLFAANEETLKEREMVLKTKTQLSQCSALANALAEERINLLQSKLRSANAKMTNAEMKCGELQKICDNLLDVCEKKLIELQ